MASQKERHGTDAGLDAYRSKRDRDRSPEPFGDRALGIPPGVFVVQKHAARRLHWDLRLELDGRLRSWAIPKGPSFDPSVKRLAVRVENHPLDYVDFEGVIPEGYGAGSMIVWDRGLWRPLEDPEAGLKAGKLLFRLDGYKLRGVWTLFVASGQDHEAKEWLLVKKPDAWAQAGGREVPETSVLSGLRVEELSEARERAPRMAARLRQKGLLERRVDLDAITPMLAETREDPFDDPGWLFELKYDGFRLLAEKSDARVRLRFRSGRDATRAFPEIRAALSALPYTNLVLDGEVVVLDDDGRPVFNRLQKRAQLERERDLTRACWLHPASYMVFDLLAAEGHDLREHPLYARKALLREMAPDSGPIRYVDHVEGRGRDLFSAIRARGLEGLVAKRKDSFYRCFRSEDWLKIRSETTEDLSVIGYTEPSGQRRGFGGLHLARRKDSGGWTYVGRVGSGFSEDLIDTLQRRFESLVVPEPVVAVPGSGRTSTWLRPEVQISVTYLNQTPEGIIRQSRFRALIDEGPDSKLDALEDEPSPMAGVSQNPQVEDAPPSRVRYTNLTKVFFPENNITKRDLLEYHRQIVIWSLPYLLDRPLAVARYPDGIHGKSFFQKHVPAFTPGWVRTARVVSEHTGQEREQFVAQDLEVIEYLVNLGCIPFHVWSSRTASLEKPDWAILDLDPKGAPFKHVVRLAQAARKLADTLHIDAYVKTSGSSGLHILLPLGARYGHDQARTLTHLLARILADRHPDIATLDRSVERRGGRVYLDFVQNGRGRLLAAPYSVRALPGAPVSTPLDWSEVDEDLDPKVFTVRSVPKRMARLGSCPLAGVLGPGIELELVLARLAEVL